MEKGRKGVHQDSKMDWIRVPEMDQMARMALKPGKNLKRVWLDSKMDWMKRGWKRLRMGRTRKIPKTGKWQAKKLNASLYFLLIVAGYLENGFERLKGAGSSVCPPMVSDREPPPPELVRGRGLVVFSHLATEKCSLSFKFSFAYWRSASLAGTASTPQNSI